MFPVVAVVSSVSTELLLQLLVLRRRRFHFSLPRSNLGVLILGATLPGVEEEHPEGGKEG